MLETWIEKHCREKLEMKIKLNSKMKKWDGEKMSNE